MDAPEDERGKTRREPPFSLRLTFAERAKLEQMAAGEPLGTYIKSRLFGGPQGTGDAGANGIPSPPIRRGRVPVKDHAALGAVLAKLGQSRLANNLNQIAKAAHIGALDVTPETVAALQEAKAEVSAIRFMLIGALGLREGTPPAPHNSPRIDP